MTQIYADGTIVMWVVSEVEGASLFNAKDGKQYRLTMKGMKSMKGGRLAVGVLFPEVCGQNPRGARGLSGFALQIITLRERIRLR